MANSPKYPARKKQNGNTTASTEQKDGPAPNGRVPCQERTHPDDEVIPANAFPFSELFPAMAGSAFDPHTMNIFTGRKFDAKHHVRGEGPKTKQHFLSFKVAFCLEWRAEKINGVWYWVRCGNSFNVHSNGCIDHPRVSHKDGPNCVYPKLLAGEEITWGDLKNKHVESEEAPLTEEQKYAKEKEEIEVMGELMAATSLTGEDTEELQAEYQARNLKMSRMRRPTGARQQDPAAMSKAAPAALADITNTRMAPVYGSRRRPGDSAPGVPMLDQKRAAPTNGRKFFRSNMPNPSLAPLPEQGQPTERRKGRKKDKAAGGGAPAQS
jgi:hypothetical protein